MAGKLLMDFDRFDFKGYGTHDSFCRVKIYRNGKKFFVVITEARDNPGTSVTNDSENVVGMIYDLIKSILAFPENHDPKKDVIWVEHQEEDNTYDEINVNYDKKANMFFDHNWLPLGEKKYKTILKKFLVSVSGNVSVNNKKNVIKIEEFKKKFLEKIFEIADDRLTEKVKKTFDEVLKEMKEE